MHLQAIYYGMPLLHETRPVRRHLASRPYIPVRCLKGHAGAGAGRLWPVAVRLTRALSQARQAFPCDTQDGMAPPNYCETLVQLKIHSEATTSPFQRIRTILPGFGLQYARRLLLLVGGNLGSQASLQINQIDVANLWHRRVRCNRLADVLSNADVKDVA